MDRFEVAIEHTQVRVFTTVVEAETEDKAQEEAESRARHDVADRENEYVKRNTYRAGNAENLSQEEYTVVGTSVNHPRGFIRVVEAESAQHAASKFDDPDHTVIAVLEDAGTNQL